LSRPEFWVGLVALPIIGFFVWDRARQDRADTRFDKWRHRHDEPPDPPAAKPD
jgi:hypothetical protein